MRTTIKFLTLLTTSILPCIGAAQSNLDAAVIPVGQFDLVPSVNVGIEFDNNITSANDDQIESWATLVAPQLSISTTTGPSDIVLSYKIENKNYFSSSEDNYTDHIFLFRTNVEFDLRHRAKVSVSYEDGHDQRGSNFSIGAANSLTEPDKFKEAEINAQYAYGAFNADGRIELFVGVRDKDYDIETPLYRARDRRFTNFGGTFLYRVGALTDATFDFKRTYNDYKVSLNPSSPLDSVTDSFLAGVAWDATAKTSGYAKVGYEKKDFDSSTREDFSGFDWQVGVTWEPMSRSTIEFTTQADTNETNGEGNFIRSNRHTAEWLHGWSDRVNTSFLVDFRNARYEGQLINDSDIRSDDNLIFDASVKYDFRRWVTLELSYTYLERESNREIVIYDRDKVMLNALITL